MIMRKVFLLLCMGFYFGFSVFGTAQTSSFVGKKFWITDYNNYYLEFKNDSLLALYFPPSNFFGRNCRFPSEKIEREYVSLSYSISSDSIIIKADDYLNSYNNEILLTAKRIFYPQYKWVKRLTDSHLIITKSEKLGITYLANNEWSYFETSYLSKQPSKLVIFKNEKFSVQGYKKYKEDKKVKRVLRKIKREEKKAGKKLYLTKIYDCQKAFLKFGIVVGQSVLYIEKL